MQERQHWKGFFIFGSLVLAVLSGCATTGVSKPASDGRSDQSTAPSNLNWWYARFKMEWNPETEPRWFVDAMIAAEILLPVIDENKDSIALWRIHRRAAPDAAGHQFSFIFYSTPEVARKVFDGINTHPVGHNLQERGLLLSIVCDNPESLAKPQVEDTSDRSWSPVLQRSWPYFIMGVSELWLTLLSQVSDAESAGAKPFTLEEKLEFYRRVDQRVQALWMQQGGHALLHHLNAVFEYEPLQVKKDMSMSF